MKSQEVRQAFLKFFQDKGHQIIPSAPILVKNDPTLMFTNAGMNPFKDFFLGHRKSPYLRVVDTQKCLRVAGKHNDLDDVGHDTYHHTMFEMLGNWSFGDYFKKEAIEWAWELLTMVYKISEENIYITIFSGDEQDRLPEDTDARRFWKNIVNKHRILPFGKKDNFWEMGAMGPCGPCSEIHVDLRSSEEKYRVRGKDLVNQDHPKVIEIWNLVFIEFLRKEDGSLEKLGSRHIDTGMGFERLCRVLQCKTSNYDTDIFTPLISKIEKYSGKCYGKDSRVDIAIRVVADHIRAVSFAVADGQLPSNNGAGYAIRRILRRAVSYAYRFFGQKKPFIYQLVPTLVAEMGDTFPELKHQESWIKQVIEEEEKNFLKTVAQGMVRMRHIIQELKGRNETVIDGVRVFELYDTYGFSTDLSHLLARENGLTIDEAGFEKEMFRQKERSRKAGMVEKGAWIPISHERADDEPKQNFLGYDKLKAQVKIIQHRWVKTPKGQHYELVFDQTPFYPEGGGQVGDSGNAYTTEYEYVFEKFMILNTIKENDLILHIVEKLPRYPHKIFEAAVDSSRREQIERNHTATHLLHHVLRKVLGKHVKQRGSYVGPDRLRFDFSHSAKLSSMEIEKVEECVQQMIFDKLPLNVQIIPLQRVLEKGLMEFFGEKYADEVRTIGFGDSIELCGGTHVSNTTKIQVFKIFSQSSVGESVRRIEAITSKEAIDYLNLIHYRYNAILNELNYPVIPIEAIQNMKEEIKDLKGRIKKITVQQAQVLKKSWHADAQRTPLASLIREKTDLDLNVIKTVAMELRKEIYDLFLLIGWSDGDQAALCVAISDNLISEQGMNASVVIQELAPYISGKGGGQKFFAMAKGSDPSGIDAALRQVESYVGLL
ncbi:MAG: alanine--tRNA ligase [Flavobacteriales bacterium Tduv]